MATTPYFLWAPQESSSAASGSDIAGFGSRETEAALVSPEVAAAVAPPRLRRQSSGCGKQQAGGNKKPPQRGLGVAELERLRFGGDPLRHLNAAVAAAAMGDAANVQGHSVHHHLPVHAFDAATGKRYISPLLVEQSPAAPAPPAPVCYVHSASAGGQSVAPEQQYFMDRWGRMGGFTPVVNAGYGHQPQLPPPPAPEHPSSQSTIWRPASSSSSCIHTGNRCDLCSRTMRALTERGARTSAAVAAATSTMPDYSIYDLAAAMATARKEKGEGFLARERKKEAAEKKEVREIEFFPMSTNNAAGGVCPDVSEFATMGSTPFSSSSSGGCTAPLDLSLRL